MAFVKNLFDSNFIQYASYVIRDRAIPDITDGFTCSAQNYPYIIKN